MREKHGFHRSHNSSREKDRGSGGLQRESVKINRAGESSLPDRQVQRGPPSASRLQHIHKNANLFSLTWSMSHPPSDQICASAEVLPCAAFQGH